MPRRKHDIERKNARKPDALALRISGCTYREIATALGVSVETAYSDVQDALGELDGIKTARAEKLREIEIERLDRAAKALSPKVEKGDTQAILALMRVMERRAKLLGLDAPVRQEVTGPAGGPISIAAYRGLDDADLVAQYRQRVDALEAATRDGR